MGSSTSISRMLVGGGRRRIGYPWGIDQSKPSFIPGTFVLMGLPPCRLLPPSHRPTSCFPNAPIDSNPQVRPVHDSFRSFFFFFFDFTVDYARAMDLFNKEGQSDGDMAMADRSNSGTVPHNGTRLRCKWPCTRSPLEHISDLCIFFPLWHADSASAMSILTTAEDHQTPLTSRMALAAASG